MKRRNLPIHSFRNGLRHLAIGNASDIRVSNVMLLLKLGGHREAATPSIGVVASFYGGETTERYFRKSGRQMGTGFVSAPTYRGPDEKSE